MTYAVGQKVNLWEINVELMKRRTVVLRSVIVTITEIKTGVLGEWSREPQNMQSLRGVDEAGNVYEKHWDAWPEAQLGCFTDRWSMRDDGMNPERRWWIPYEAIHVYNEFVRARQRDIVDQLVFADSREALPSGDNIGNCKTHGTYFYLHEGQSNCFHCLMEDRKKKSFQSA